MIAHRGPTRNAPREQPESSSTPVTGLADAAQDVVVILDDVRLAPEQLDNWLTKWRANYLPAARRRGLTLRGVWSGWSATPEEASVVICWSMSRIGHYWAARFEATEDPSVRAFWEWTDSLATSRDRRVLHTWRWS